MPARLSRESSEYLISVILGLYLFEYLLDLSLLVDQKGCSMNAHVCSPHEFLLTVNAVSIRYRMIGIG